MRERRISITTDDLEAMLLSVEQRLSSLDETDPYRGRLNFWTDTLRSILGADYEHYAELRVFERLGKGMS